MIFLNKHLNLQTMKNELDDNYDISVDNMLDMSKS